MALLLKSGAVFIHIPKTGGTWVRKILHDQDLIKFSFSHEHADYERVINSFGHYPGSFLRRSFVLKKSLDVAAANGFKFCFVRNPFNWYESYWKYMCGLNWKSFKKQSNPSRFGLKCDLWHPWEQIEKCGDKDFNVFIENVIKNLPGYLSQMYNLYIPYDKVDFIGKQENLSNDLLKVLKKMNLKIDEDYIKNQDKINQSVHEVPEWDKTNREMIFKLEYPAFYRFGYYNEPQS